MVRGDNGPVSTRPWTLRVAGLVRLAVGLGCLGWVVYQYFGTNIVADRVYSQERQQIRAAWQSPQSSSTRPGARQASDPGPAIGLALLRIPAFGADYEVPILQGIDADTLASGVGHYPSTAAPGQVGNFAIAGHRVTHGQPFAHLLRLNAGDDVIVETRTAIYTYELDTAPRDLTVPDTASWVLDPVPGHPDTKPTKALLTLTTCQDLFHSPDRSAAFGHLVRTQRKG